MRILVTGKNGLVGSCLNKDYIFVGKNDCDLTVEHKVDNLIKFIRPDCIIHTAAKVGGIGGNISGPADYFYQNIIMNSHIIHYAWKYGVKKLIAFSSVCVFPDGIPVLKEDLMHSGEPYYSQRAYACAKRAIDIQIDSYRLQHGIKNYCSIIPANIFGENDLYDLKNGHVIPSLIHKIYLAKKENKPLIVWGDGSAKREFIYSADLSKIIDKLVSIDIPQRLIISRNGEISIKEVVEKLCKIAGFDGEVIWDTSKPNGQKSRPTDLSLLNSLMKVEYTDFDIALENSYRWFENNYPNVRGL